MGMVEEGDWIGQRCRDAEGALMPLPMKMREEELDSVPTGSCIDVGRGQLALSIPLVGFGLRVEMREAFGCLAS